VTGLVSMIVVSQFWFWFIIKSMSDNISGREGFDGSVVLETTPFME